MFNKRMLLAVAAMSVLATGCYKDAAQQALGDAYKAACKGDLRKLNGLLTGDALAQFGTAEGAAAICSRVSAEQDKKLKLEDRKIGEVAGPRGRAVSRTYSVDVLKDERVVANATVECAVTWDWVRDGGNCGPSAGYPYPYPPYPGQLYPYPYPHPRRGGYRGGYCNPGNWHLVDYEACRVASLKN